LGRPRLDALDLIPCYEVTSFDLDKNYYSSSSRGFSYAFAVFGSEQFPQPQKIAWQVIASSSVSGLAVMNSGFYLPVDAFSLPPLRTTENNPPQLLAAQGWELDFAAVTVAGAAISPSAERAAVWGKTPDNPPAYFLNLFDVRTAQQIAQVRLESDPALGTFSAAFSPDGRLLASIDRGGTLSFWRVKRTIP
jgi:WD40 repeat protein